MTSIRDMYNSAKSKITGQEAEPADEFSTEDYDEQDDDFGGYGNDAVKPIVDRPSRYEQDRAAGRSPREHHSAGLDSLFAPTTKKNRVMADSSEETKVIEPVKTESAPRPSAPPSMTAPQEKVVTSRKVRQVAVINPDSYEEAEIVAKALKDGNVVIIDLRTTPQQLANRFLDFSFGCTAALNGKVDTIDSKVYVITTGPGISALEIERVRKDGLL